MGDSICGYLDVKKTGNDIGTRPMLVVDHSFVPNVATEAAEATVSSRDIFEYVGRRVSPAAATAVTTWKSVFLFITREGANCSE